MTLTEKRAWCLLVAALGTYTWYVATVLRRSGDGPLWQTPYVVTLLISIGISICVSIATEIVLSIANPRGERHKDERDRTIDRLGDQVGQSFVIIGAVGALVMALAEWPGFWIANIIYLCFVASAVLSSIAKIIMNRRAVPEP